MIKVLATDLDGTLIPLEGNQKNAEDLRTLESLLVDRSIELVFVTGRHLELAVKAISDHDLPMPGWIISDVGTTVASPDGSKQNFAMIDEYQSHLNSIVGGSSADVVMRVCDDIADVRLQETEKQGEFKISYYTDAKALRECQRQVIERLKKHELPYGTVASVDPFTGDGLLDVLPSNVSETSAIDWWQSHRGVDSESLVFAGDSGNDLAALTSGRKSILVGNADEQIRNQVRSEHERNGWRDRLSLPDSPATSGVLAGVQEFLAVKGN